MIQWSKQGPAVVGATSLITGRQVKVVLVGPRENPKGAVVVLASAEGATDPRPVTGLLEQLAPGVVAEILCTQERLFGATGLPAPQIA